MKKYWIVLVVVCVAGAAFAKKPPPVAERVKQADTDQDQKVSLAEYLAYCSKTAKKYNAKKSEGYFNTQLDANADGFVTLEEWESRYKANRQKNKKAK